MQRFEPRQDDRGFFEDEKDGRRTFYYVMRVLPSDQDSGEEVELSEEQFRVLKVVDDMINRWMFINTRDLKKSLDALTAATVRRLYEDERKIARR